MDVRCPACNVEYEFDDAKVTTSGVTVKCTNCTHIFKVRTQGDKSGPQRPITEDIEWVVRCADGRNLRFRELTTLQKWIVERKVSSSDEISRSGRNWKRLSEIAELSAFFQVVEAADKARRLGQQNTTNPTPLNLPEPVPAKIGPGGKPTLETFFDPDQLDDDDPVKEWKKSRGGYKFALTLAVLAASAGAAIVYFRPDLAQAVLAKLQGTETPGTRAQTMMQKALNKDDAAEAMTLLEQLAPKAAAPRADAATVAAVSRLYTLRARHLSAELALQPPVAPGETKPPNTALREARDEAQKNAYQSAVRALAAPGERALAQLASADYQAQRGAIAEMESDLEAALAAATGQPRSDLQKEADIVRALGLTTRALNAPTIDAAAIAKAEEAIARAQARVMEDARLSFAIIRLAARRQNGGNDPAPLDAFIAKHPEHIPAAALRRTLKIPPKGADTVPPAPTTPADKPSATDGAKTSDPAESAKPATEAAAPPKESYAKTLKRADRLRLSDRARASVSLYKKASKLKPSASAPHLGLGWAYLDLDRLTSSIRSFRKAVSLNGKSAQGYLGLGEVYRARGEKEKAISAFKAYLAIKPSGRDADTARRAIKSLQ